MSDIPRTLSELKARLAPLGVDVHHSATMQLITRPPAGVTVDYVVLDRVEDVPKPSYCVHGFCTCNVCGEICYLGSETSKLVAEQQAQPICLTCAKLYIPHEKREPHHWVEDNPVGKPHTH